MLVGRDDAFLLVFLVVDMVYEQYQMIEEGITKYSGAAALYWRWREYYNDGWRVEKGVMP